MSTSWTVIIQDLSGIENTLRFIEETYQRGSGLYLGLEKPLPFGTETQRTEEECAHNVASDTDTIYEVADSLAYLQSRCSTFRGWASNYLDRTNTRIQLVREVEPTITYLITTKSADFTSQDRVLLD